MGLIVSRRIIVVIVVAFADAGAWRLNSSRPRLMLRNLFDCAVSCLSTHPVWSSSGWDSVFPEYGVVVDLGKGSVLELNVSRG